MLQRESIVRPPPQWSGQIERHEGRSAGPPISLPFMYFRNNRAGYQATYPRSVARFYTVFISLNVNIRPLDALGE